jgi:hypothetical protein
MNASTRMPARPLFAVLLLLNLACGLVPAPAAAEEPAAQQPLAPGMTVRIEAPGLLSADRTGTIRALDDRSISIDVEGRAEPVTVQRDQISRFQVSAGRSSRLVHTLLGAAIGGVAVALIPSHGANYPGERAAVVAIGGLLGAGVGAALPAGERWTDIPTARYRISLLPRLDSTVGLTVSRAF